MPRRAPISEEDFSILSKDYSNFKRKVTSEDNPSVPTRLFNGGILPNYPNHISLLIFESQLRELAQHDTGQRLLTKVAELANADAGSISASASSSSQSNSKPFQVILTDVGDNQYDLESNEVRLNFGKAIAANQGGHTKLFSIYPLIQGKTPISPESKEELIVSKEGLSPFFISVFHEFNHYKDHKDTNSKLFQYGSDKLLDPYPQTRIDKITYNLREHRTIFDGDDTDTSELLLRMEAKEPLRYLYQPVTHGAKHLYEPVERVLKNAVRFIPKDNKAKIGEVTQGLSQYVAGLPLVQIQPEKAYAKYMDVDLAPLFPAAFGKLERSEITGFVNRRLRPAPKHDAYNNYSDGDSDNDYGATSEIRRAKIAKRKETNRNMGILDASYKRRNVVIPEKQYLEAFHMFAGLKEAKEIAQPQHKRKNSLF